MMKDKVIRPSRSDVWVHCPASVFQHRLSNIPNEYAKRGKRLHEIIYEVFKQTQKNIANPDQYFDIKKLIIATGEKEGTVLEEDEVVLLMTYYNYIINLKPKFLRVEHKLNLDEFIPTAEGTCDAIVLNKNNDLFIIDLKTGAKPVRETNNYQLLLYTLGSLELLKEKTINNIYNVIVQSSWKDGYNNDDDDDDDIDTSLIKSTLVSKDMIENFKAVLYKTKEIWLSDNPEKALVEGEHCKYCPSLVTCPKKKAKLSKMLTTLNANPNFDLSVDDMVRHYLEIKSLDTVEKQLKSRIEFELLENNKSSKYASVITKNVTTGFNRDLLVQKCKDKNLDISSLFNIKDIKGTNLKEYFTDAEIKSMRNYSEKKSVKFKVLDDDPSLKKK